MDQKPPRPRTLHLPSTAVAVPKKSTTRSGRHRRHGGLSSRGKSASELKQLANNIQGIIEDISFQRSDDSGKENVMRRSYIGISRSATFDEQPRYGRRNIVSAFYGENRSVDNVTRESSVHLSKLSASERYERDMRLGKEVKTAKRQSCPWDLAYFDEEENRSLQILANELNYLREIREKEVRDLLDLNNKLQHNLYDADRQIFSLEEKNVVSEKRLDDMLRVYERIRENLKQCLSRVKDLESLGKLSTPLNSDDETAIRSKSDLPADQVSLSSGFHTLSSDISESISLGASALGYEGDGEGSTCGKRRDFLDVNDLTKDIDSISLESRSTCPTDARDDSPPERQTTSNNEHNSSPDQVMLGRLRTEVESLTQINAEQSQDIERLQSDLSSCRKHMMSSQFQLEAVEIECSRLLAMEDQLVSVITLLKRAKELHMHRQILGDIILNAVTVAREEDDSNGIPADIFLRELQDQLASNPTLATIKPRETLDDILLSDVRADKGTRRKQGSYSQQTTMEQMSSSLVQSAQSQFESLRKHCPSPELSISDQSTAEKRSLTLDVQNLILSCNADLSARQHRKHVLEEIKFIDDEEDQLSDTDSFHSLGKHLNGEENNGAEFDDK